MTPAERAALIERLREPTQFIHRATKQLTVKSPPAVQLEAATALADAERERDEARDMAAVGEDLMAAIEAVQHEDSEYKDWSPADSPAEIVTDLYEDLRAAEAQVAALKAALQPFAALAERFDPPEQDDNCTIWGEPAITLGMLRRARATLAVKGENHG